MTRGEGLKKQNTTAESSSVLVLQSLSPQYDGDALVKASQLCVSTLGVYRTGDVLCPTTSKHAGGRSDICFRYRPHTPYPWQHRLPAPYVDRCGVKCLSRIGDTSKLKAYPSAAMSS
jgi:hypothetical protein